MKLKVFFGLVFSLSIFMTGTAFAVGWQDNDHGRWYDRGNGTKFMDEWQWIDGNGDGIAECYYLDGGGYCLRNTTTSDGYTVNAEGAWVVDGVVQTKQDNSASLRTYTGYVNNEALGILNKERTELEKQYPQGIPYRVQWGRQSNNKQYAWDVSGEIKQILKTDNIEEIISYYKNLGWSAYKVNSGGMVEYYEYWLVPPSSTSNKERYEIQIAQSRAMISRSYAIYNTKEEL